MKAICLYGGRFDPVHVAHLILAELAREALKLDQITFLPTPNPPHKGCNTAFCHRYAMLKLAVADDHNFVVSDIEEKRGGVSYTIDTVRYFLDKCGFNRVYFLMGSDSLAEIKTWREWQELIQLAKVVVIGRPGHDINNVDSDILKQVEQIETPTFEISASMIRQRVREGRSIRFMVPVAVERYIISEGLYLE